MINVACFTSLFSHWMNSYAKNTEDKTLFKHSIYIELPEEG